MKMDYIFMLAYTSILSGDIDTALYFHYYIKKKIYIFN